MYRVCCVLYDGWCLMSDTWCLVCDVCCLMSDICCLFQTSDISWLMSDVWCAILLSDVRRQIIIIKIIIFITWYCANEHILKDQNANPKTWKANLFKYYYTAGWLPLLSVVLNTILFFVYWCFPRQNLSHSLSNNDVHLFGARITIRRNKWKWKD